MRQVIPIAAAGCLLLSTVSCGDAFSEEEACQMVKDYVAEKAGFELHDAYRFPLVKYRNVEVIECHDFESDSRRGWARLHVRALGEEYEAEAKKLLGERTEFNPTFEFDRYDQGWKIVE